MLNAQHFTSVLYECVNLVYIACFIVGDGTSAVNQVCGQPFPGPDVGKHLPFPPVFSEDLEVLSM